MNNICLKKMFNFQFYAMIVILSVPKRIECGVTCLACSGISHARDCGIVKRCGDHEACYSELFVSPGGYLLQNLGCRDTRQCGTTTGKRRAANVTLSMTDTSRRFITDRTTCSECCKTDLCNDALCGQAGYPLHMGPICYTCEQMDLPTSCNTILQCGRDQVCALQKVVAPSHEHLEYRASCMHTQTCIKEFHDVEHNPVMTGRRNTNIQLGAGQTCRMKCCDTSLCNGVCQLSSSTLLVPTHPTTTPAPTAAATYTGGVLSCGGAYHEQFKGRCYYFNMQQTSWETAKNACHGKNDKLIELESREEHDFIRHYIQLYYPGTSTRCFWIGAEFHDSSQDYVWYEAATLVPRFGWAPGQPSAGSGACVNYNINTMWLWTPEPNCNTNCASICEKHSY